VGGTGACWEHKTIHAAREYGGVPRDGTGNAERYAALTVEGIAARAGAGKQTIYRWWPSKADVVLEAMLEEVASAIAAPDKGSLPDDLVAFLSETFQQRAQRPVLLGLMAQALLDPGFAQAFRDRFLFSRRAALREILERAAARGEIAAEVDPELLIDVVYGVLWYRLLLVHPGHFVQQRHDHPAISQRNTGDPRCFPSGTEHAVPQAAPLLWGRDGSYGFRAW
jgi:AcrR family transcriptional regulator